MAIYHMSIKIGSKGKGQSAVAAAAYRSGDKLTDKETGLISDYTRKGGVVHSEISLCDNAPAEYADRETLWNSVHQIEKAKDARLWREIEVALPIHNKDRDAAFYHAHVVMNAVSYKDGKLFHSGFSELNEICRKVSDVTGRCCKLVIEESKKEDYQEKWYRSAEQKPW